MSKYERLIRKMLKFYLHLQARRLHRMVVGMGGYPILNYLVVVAVFLFISFVMYFNIKYFSVSYSLIALFIVSMLSNPEYQDFLKLTYNKSDYLRIRIMENTVIAFPFAYFLCCSGKVLTGLVVLALSALLVFFSPKVRWQRAIPTPFSKYPFEFIAGFRAVFIFFPGSYYLTYVSIKYANYGIGIFAIMLVSIICSLFYGLIVKVEDEFYVWIYSAKAKEFLGNKIKIAALSTLILSLPILIALIIFNPGKVIYILAFQALGLCFVSAGVVCKYSTFPGEIGTKEGLLSFFSVLIPPMLLFTLPYLYKKAIRSLKGILE